MIDTTNFPRRGGQSEKKSSCVEGGLLTKNFGAPRIRGVNLRLLHNPTGEEIEKVVSELKGWGVTHVAVVPHHYVYLQPGTPRLALPPKSWGEQYRWFIWPDYGQDPNHPFQNTPRPSTTYNVLKAIYKAGMKPMLKPHVDSYDAAWRGYIEVAHLPSDWTWAYKERLLRPYLAMVRSIPDCALIFGTELYTVTKQLGATFWQHIAQWLRKEGVRSELTYAANWGHGDDAEFTRLEGLWHDVNIDYVGVDAYWPIISPDGDGRLGPVAFGEAWITPQYGASPYEAMVYHSERSGKPLLLTEIGYQNVNSANEFPWGVPWDVCSLDTRNDAIQRDLTWAMKSTFQEFENFAGYLWWEAPLLGSTWHDPCDVAGINHIPQPETRNILFSK
jgi:hypothetical protein